MATAEGKASKSTAVSIAGIRPSRAALRPLLTAYDTVLMGHPGAKSIFGRPVDPIADGAEDYYRAIRHPMDLGTLRDRIVSHWYYDLFEEEEARREEELDETATARDDRVTASTTTGIGTHQKETQKTRGKKSGGSGSGVAPRARHYTEVGPLSHGIRQDLSLVLSNCREYNKDDHPITDMAKVIVKWGLENLLPLAREIDGRVQQNAKSVSGQRTSHQRPENEKKTPGMSAGQGSSQQADERGMRKRPREDDGKRTADKGDLSSSAVKREAPGAHKKAPGATPHRAATAPSEELRQTPSVTHAHTTKDKDKDAPVGAKGTTLSARTPMSVPPAVGAGSSAGSPKPHTPSSDACVAPKPQHRAEKEVNVKKPKEEQSQQLPTAVPSAGGTTTARSTSSAVTKVPLIQRVEGLLRSVLDLRSNKGTGGGTPIAPTSTATPIQLARLLVHVKAQTGEQLFNDSLTTDSPPGCLLESIGGEGERYGKDGHGPVVWRLDGYSEAVLATIEQWCLNVKQQQQQQEASRSKTAS